MKAFDFCIGVIMLGMLVHYVLRGSHDTAPKRAAQAVIVCVMLLALSSLSKDLIFEGLFSRNSPSLELHPFIMIAQTTGWHVKDSSPRSFPGDHAIVVATFVYLLWSFAGRRYGLAALLAALVAGAHWMSDDLVGGLGAALVTVPWVIHTPIGPFLVRCLAPVMAWPIQLWNRVVAHRPVHVSDPDERR